MPVQLPILEQIIAAIAARLAAVRVANGYQVDVAAVVRRTRAGWPKAIADHSVGILQGEENDQETSNPARPGLPDARPFWALRQELLYPLFLSPSDRDETAIERLENIFFADVVRALMIDPTFGGLAVRSTVRPRRDFVFDDGSYSGVLVVHHVHYAIHTKNPYLQGG